GQRLSRAKYSPLRLKMPIWRPFTWRTRGLPGTTSSTRATTCFSSLPKAVKLLGVGREDAALGFLVEGIFEGVARIVHVPMGIVGRKQQPVGPHPLDDIADLAGDLRLLDRLGGVPDVAAHVLGGWTLHLRALAAIARPDLVQPPGQRRRPGEAALHGHE